MSIDIPWIGMDGRFECTDIVAEKSTFASKVQFCRVKIHALFVRIVFHLCRSLLRQFSAASSPAICDRRRSLIAREME